MEIHDYLRVIKKRKWLMVEAVVVTIAAALTFTLLQKPKFEASATLYIRQPPQTSGFFMEALTGGEPENFRETQAAMVRLTPVLAGVIDQLGLRLSPEALSDKVNVVLEPRTSLLHIKVRDENPALARDIANALSGQYIKWSRQSMGDELAVAREQLFYKLRDVQEDIRLLAELRQRKNRGARKDELEAKWNIATNLYVMLSEKYEQLRVTEAMRASGGVLVSKATLPRSPVEPNPLRNGLAALAVGLGLGVGFAFLREQLDITIQGPDDLQQYTKLPILGQIPADRISSAKNKLAAVVEPDSSVAEAYRLVRTNLSYLEFDGALKKIAVTSPRLQEGKSTAAANLAFTIAMAGSRVILISGDLRRPTLHKYLPITRREGLSDVLAGRLKLKDVLQDVGVENLRFVCSGRIPPNPAELLASPRFDEMMNDAAKMAHAVIIDTPPVLAVADTASIGPRVDGVVLVARAGVTTRDTFRQAEAMLANVQAKVLGALITDLSESDQYLYYSYRRKKSEQAK